MDHESISFWSIGQKLKNYAPLSKHSHCESSRGPPTKTLKKKPKRMIFSFF